MELCKDVLEVWILAHHYSKGVSIDQNNLPILSDYNFYSHSCSVSSVKKIVDRFVQLYDPTYLHQPTEKNKTVSGFPWATIENLAKSMELNDLAAVNAGDYFYGQGIAKLFSEEMIEAATLVNYGQEIYSIHGVGGGVSLAASGAAGVSGGNYKIFEEFLGKCDNLKLRMGVHGEVTGLARFKTMEEVISSGKLTEDELLEKGHFINSTPLQDNVDGKLTKWWLGTKSGYGDLFDAVFIAVPWHSSGISLLNTHSVIPTYDYVRLHVTILVTTADQPDPSYFGRGKGDAIPNTILTSHIALRKAAEARKPKQGKGKLKKETKLWPGGGSDEKKGPVLEVFFDSIERAS